jgi:hypothetical protein
MKKWPVMHDVALDWTKLAREAQVFREQREHVALIARRCAI